MFMWYCLSLLVCVCAGEHTRLHSHCVTAGQQRLVSTPGQTCTGNSWSLHRHMRQPLGFTVILSLYDCVCVCGAGGGVELSEVRAETRGAPSASCRVRRILQLQSEQLALLQIGQCTLTHSTGVTAQVASPVLFSNNKHRFYKTGFLLTFFPARWKIVVLFNFYCFIRYHFTHQTDCPWEKTLEEHLIHCISLACCRPNKVISKLINLKK